MSDHDDVLEEIVKLERALRGVVDLVVRDDVRVEVGVDLLEELGCDPERVRELLEPIDDDALVDLVQNKPEQLSLLRLVRRKGRRRG